MNRPHIAMALRLAFGTVGLACAYTAGVMSADSLMTRLLKEVEVKDSELRNCRDSGNLNRYVTRDVLLRKLENAEFEREILAPGDRGRLLPLPPDRVKALHDRFRKSLQGGLPQRQAASP